MPTYAAVGSIGSQHGVPVVVWSNEQPASGSGGASASMAVALPDSSYDKKRPFSVSAKFAGAAAGGEIDIQAADVDVDTNYQTIQGGIINTFDAINNTFLADVPDNTHRFVRLLMRTQPNQSVTATITP